MMLVCKVVKVWQDFLSEYVDKKFTYICYRQGAVKTATNYNGDKPKRRQPERRQNGKAKTATHLNGDNENGDCL